MINEKKSSSGQDGGTSRSKWDILGRLADRYDQTERARIDAAKDSLRDEPISLYDSYGSGREAISPTRAKKIGIALLDAAGLRFGRLEERRERDARRAAKSELAKEFQALDAASVMTFSDDSEMPKSENPYPDLGKQDELPHKPDVQITDIIEPIENEEARLERQREIREKLENDLNERLLTVATLEREVQAGNPGVSKEFAEYDGAQIPIYNLHGLDFAMLLHNVTFKSNPNISGSKTAQRVVDDPSFWARHKSAVDFSFDRAMSADMVADTICTSYINSENSYNNYSHGSKLTYGFGGVRNGALLGVTDGDGNTGRNSESYSSKPLEFNSVQKLDEGSSGFSEVTLKRYSESGDPKLPDYIVVENKSLSAISNDEVALRHAAYFGIPIINIETKVYQEKTSERCEAILSSINEESDFEDACRKIRKVSLVSGFRRYNELNAATISIGRDWDVSPALSHDKSDHYARISQIMLPKRLEYIESKLKEYTDDILAATKAGKPAPSAPRNLNSFNIVRVSGQEVRGRDGRTLSGCDQIRIGFSLSEVDGINVVTGIYDGEHSVDSEGNAAPGADSSAYDRIAPLVAAYEEAMRENRRVVYGRE